jgi:hypothetical protein
VRDPSHRIKGYARIRNAALDPMYDAIRNYQSSGGMDGWLPDRVLFINDVFWCAEDGLRLLAVGDGGEEQEPTTDAAMDAASAAAQAQAQAQALQLPPSATPSVSVEGKVSAPLPRRSPSARPHMVCGLDFARSGGPGGLVYYDHWVARDRFGQRLARPQYPFYADEFDNAAFDEARRMDVFACWGGMVALDGTIFSQDGLSLRARTEHCSSSECAHLPADIISVRGKDAWIQQDNMVATSYNEGVREEVNKQEWWNTTRRLERRKKRRTARAKADVRGCKQLAAAQGRPVPSDAPSCPALPYPLGVYTGRAVSYPPPHWCCGEFLVPGPYWMNCHPVVTQLFTDEQKEAMRAANFDPFVDLHTHKEVPYEWAQAAEDDTGGGWLEGLWQFLRF